MISKGQKIPSVKIKQVTEAGTADIDTAEFFHGKRVAMFSLPGAFTATCSQKHLPGFVRDAEKLHKKADVIACLSVNDAFIMDAWAKDQGAHGKVVMLADGNADFSKALGIEVDLAKAGMGTRCRRGLIVAKDGVVESIEMEEPGKLDVSSSEACALKLGA
jgi:peroxiredoxin